jgi:hypothetical protein
MADDEAPDCKGAHIATRLSQMRVEAAHDKVASRIILRRDSTDRHGGIPAGFQKALLLNQWETSGVKSIQ